MWWKGRDQNNNELHETFFEAFGPTFIYHFANNDLGDKLILSFIYFLFDECASHTETISKRPSIHLSNSPG